MSRNDFEILQYDQEKMKKRYLILKELLPLLNWMRDAREHQHGEDCGYWDWETDKPSGEPCECGMIEIRNIILAHDAVK